MDNTKERIKFILCGLVEKIEHEGDYELAKLDADDAFWLVNKVEELSEKNEKLRQQLDAKLVFINNGWEEERYALQDLVERYEKAIESRKVCDNCNSVIRKTLEE